MLHLNIIIASTRPGRVGWPVGAWFHEFAREHGRFDVHLVDLAEFDLPILDEPHHPRQQKYQHAHTKRWSESVNAADAYVLVTPEYNFGPTPALVNALNYVYKEWNYKPAGFVSYGGISGGLRAAQVTKQTLGAMKVVPLPEQVTIPMVAQHIQDDRFVADEYHEEGGKAMLGELHRWAEALKILRE